MSKRNRESNHREQIDLTKDREFIEICDNKFIEICDKEINVHINEFNRNVKLKLVGDAQSPYDPCVYNCVYPIYHPAVSNFHGVLVYGKNQEDVIRQLTDLNYACQLPFNKNATIDFKQNKAKFWEINAQLWALRDTECAICLETFSSLDKFVVNPCKSHLHIFHNECAKTLEKCPLCRWKWNT